MSSDFKSFDRGDGDDERASDLALMDAGEYKNKKRLEKILEAHDRVEEVEQEAFALLTKRHGGITARGRDIAVLKAVQSFIRECYNLLRQHHEEYTQNNQDRCDGYWVRESPIGVIERENGENIVFSGLADILNAQEDYTHTYDEVQERRHGPDVVKTHTEVDSVPTDVSMRAYLLMKKFLGEERALDLEFDEDTGDKEFDYSDLLQNGHAKTQ